MINMTLITHIPWKKYHPVVPATISSYCIQTSLFSKAVEESEIDYIILTCLHLLNLQQIAQDRLCST